MDILETRSPTRPPCCRSSRDAETWPEVVRETTVETVEVETGVFFDGIPVMRSEEITREVERIVRHPSERVEVRTADGWWEATKVGPNVYVHALIEPTPEKVAAEAAHLAACEAELAERVAARERRSALREAAKKGALTPEELQEALGLLL